MVSRLRAPARPRYSCRTPVEDKGVYVWTFDLWYEDEPPGRCAAGCQLCLLDGPHVNEHGLVVWLDAYDGPAWCYGDPLPLTPGGLDEAHWHAVHRTRQGDFDERIAARRRLAGLPPWRGNP